MYTIYLLDFDLLYSMLYPPLLRLEKHMSWGKVLTKPLQYLHDLIFQDYANGSFYYFYDNSISYVVGDRTIFTDRSVYECIQNTTGNDPTNIVYWVLVNDIYIGVRERIRYNSQKILFEFALNRWFMCAGIYISNLPITIGGLLMGATSEYSSTLSSDSSPLANPTYLTNAYIVPSTFDYTIYVPLAIFNSLSTTSIDSENIIRSFADRYNLAGMTYNVVAY